MLAYTVGSQGEQVAAAFQTAVAALPSQSGLQRILLSNLNVYTNLLQDRLFAERQLDRVVPAKEARTSAQKPTYSVEYLGDCVRLLADTVGPQGAKSELSPLANALHTIRATVQHLLNQHSLPLPAGTAKIISIVVNQVISICMLQHKHLTLDIGPQHNHQLQQQLDHNLLPSIVLLAAEVEQLLNHRVTHNAVTLTAHNIQAVGGP